MARTFGIDVSDWQGNINWSAVAASGKTFAFIRATRGGTTGTYNESTRVGTLSERYDDTKFLANITNAKAAGLLVGAYHFARPDISMNTGCDEAVHFLQVAGDYMCDGYLPPVLDLEAGSARSTADLTNWAMDFCNTIHDAKGVWPIVYANSSYANSEVDARLAQLPLWIARPSGDPNAGNPAAAAAYPNVYGVWNPTYPNTPSPEPWNFWQYSSTGTVYGINGNVDLDVFNGDVYQLQRQFLRGYTAPTKLTQVLDVRLAGAGGGVLDNGGAIDLGDVLQNSASPVFSVQVTNIGTGNLTFSGLKAIGPYVIDDGLVSVLKPGQTDTFTLHLNTSIAYGGSGMVSFAIGGVFSGTFWFDAVARVVPPTTPCTGAIYGFIYDDRNGNGRRDAGEFGLSGWDVWLDVNGNGRRDRCDPVVTTSAAGEYQFPQLPPGPTVVHPVIPAGWYQSAPGTNGILMINVFPKVTTRAKDFSMARPASISGRFFCDANRNGKRDPYESGSVPWTVYIDRNLNGTLDAGDVQVTTDQYGFFRFDDLRPGTYVIRVAPKKGYALTGTSVYQINLFSGDCIVDRDFGYRTA
jgi:GH25 family lysozyme M1 (1,4-beta-N-acetylmuramidase)